MYLNDFDTKSCVGKTFKSKNYGDFKVIDYKNSKSVLIRFLETGFTKICHTKEVRNGSVKDLLRPSVYGVGFLGSDIKTSYINDNGVKCNYKTYDLWTAMLSRCYSDRKRSSYQGCSVSDEFLNYTKFKEWCENQKGFKLGFDLDKDILGGDVYSPETCVFVPREINSVLTKREVLRGKHPIGVYKDVKSGKFIAQVSLNLGSQEYLGRFESAQEAFEAYKNAKENYVKFIANKWKDTIDVRAYERLICYTVNIDD